LLIDYIEKNRINGLGETILICCSTGKLSEEYVCKIIYSYFCVGKDLKVFFLLLRRIASG